MIRKAPAGSKLSERKRIRNKLDRLCAAVVRQGTCLAEGYKGYQCSCRIECAHIGTRGWEKIRHSPFNMVPLCNIHHRWFTQNPDAWKEFIESVYPGRMDYLMALRKDGGETQEYWMAYWTKRLKEGV